MCDKTIKILQVGMSDNLGGIESYLMQQFRALNKEKIIYDFVSITQSEKICFETEIKRTSNIYKFCSRRKNPLLHYWQLFIFLLNKKREYVAIVLNADSLYYVYPLFIGKIFAIPIRVIHSHNSGLQIKTNLLRKILVLFNRCIVNFSATDYWACSQKAGEWMFGKDKKFKIIHNAINSEVYKFNEFKRNEMRNKLNLNDKFVVGHIGRFSYQKNHEFLIKVFQEILKIENNSRLLLVGDGEDRENIEVQARKIGVIDKIIFLGLRNDVPDLMQAMDCFVLPSHFEGLPLVAVEAQAAGLKSYLSDVISNEVKITDLVNFISLQQEPKYWAQRILEGRNYERKDMSREIKAAGYDIKSEIGKIEKFYLEL